MRVWECWTFAQPATWKGSAAQKVRGGMSTVPVHPHGDLEGKHCSGPWLLPSFPGWESPSPVPQFNLL